MNSDDQLHLLAELDFLRQSIITTPEQARLTRMSIEARIRKIESQLAVQPVNITQPRAKLTFDGAPVIGSHGIFVDFGTKAVNSFTDAVAMVAASLSSPLSAMGPIPNREQNQLLITGTVIGSFGFELEEHQPSQLPFDQAGTAMTTALAHVQTLLQSTMGPDDDLADVASETDPRALEKIRSFLKILVDNSATCAFQYAERSVRFADVDQVERSLARLQSDNLHESEIELMGVFLGVLPHSRTFEFRLSGGTQIVRGKVAVNLQDIETLNSHLGIETEIQVIKTQIGNGRPRYVLTRMPSWNQPH